MSTNKIVNKDYLERQFYLYNRNVVNPQFATLNTSAGNKVDKISGYGLSENDFTDALKTKLQNLENYVDNGNNGTTIRELIGDNTDAISTLNGSASSSGSVGKIVNDRVALMIGGENLSYETLGEISNWIGSHVTSAEDMEDAISENEDDILALQQQQAAASYEYETTDLDFTSVNTITVTGDSTVAVGSTITLTSDVTGVTWVTSDDTKATVSSVGVVTGASTGSVTISAVKSGFVTGTKEITVTAANTESPTEG